MNKPLSRDGRDFVGQGRRWEVWSKQCEASDLLLQLFGVACLPGRRWFSAVFDRAHGPRRLCTIGGQEPFNNW